MRTHRLTWCLAGFLTVYSSTAEPRTPSRAMPITAEVVPESLLVPPESLQCRAGLTSQLLHLHHHARALSSPPPSSSSTPALTAHHHYCFPAAARYCARPLRAQTDSDACHRRHHTGPLQRAAPPRIDHQSLHPCGHSVGSGTVPCLVPDHAPELSQAQNNAGVTIRVFRCPWPGQTDPGFDATSAQPASERLARI